MFLFVYLVILVMVIWFIVFRYQRRHLYKLAAVFPKSGKELPVIGVAHTMTGNLEDIMETLQKFSYEAINTGGILRLWFGPLLYLMPVDPVDIEMVLKTCLEKDYMYRFLKECLGDGILTAPVSIWARRRRNLGRFFTTKIIDNFVEVFSAKSAKLAKLLSNCTNIGKFSMWPFIVSCSFDAVNEFIGDVNLKTQGNPDSLFLKIFDNVQNLVTERLFHIWLHPNWLYKLLPQSTEMNKQMALYYEHINEVFKTKEFVNLLLTLSGGDEGYSNVELRDEIITLLVAGTGTTAVSTGFTLKLLGKYPEVQEKLYWELRDVFGDSDRPLVREDLKRLEYLDRVVKETLRLFPPVPFITRKVTEYTRLPSGRVLPAGSSVVVPIWGVHRDPKYWGPDAESFDPDRFLPERLKLIHPYSYIPFSFGPRNCVAFQFGIILNKTMLSAILRRYRVVGDKETSPAPSMRIKFDIVLKAVDQFKLELKDRK